MAHRRSGFSKKIDTVHWTLGTYSVGALAAGITSWSDGSGLKYNNLFPLVKTLGDSPSHGSPSNSLSRN